MNDDEAEEDDSVNKSAMAPIPSSMEFKASIDQLDTSRSSKPDPVPVEVIKEEVKVEEIPAQAYVEQNFDDMMNQVELLIGQASLEDAA